MRSKIILKNSHVINPAEFVTYSAECDGDVLVEKGSLQVDGKSILGLTACLGNTASAVAIVEFTDNHKNSKFKEYITQYV